MCPVKYYIICINYSMDLLINDIISLINYIIALINDFIALPNELVILFLFPNDPITLLDQITGSDRTSMSCRHSPCALLRHP